MVKYYHIDFKYLTRRMILTHVVIIGIVIVLVILSNWNKSSIFNGNSMDNSNSYNAVDSTSNVLCVLVRVHSGHMSYLPVIALALSQAGFDNIHLYVLSIDKHIDRQQLMRTVDMVNTVTNRSKYASILDVGVPKEGDYGYTLTDLALNYLYNQYEHSPFACQYIIFTNGDNLYSQYLGKNILPHIHAKKDIIAWDFVSRYYRGSSVKAGTGTSPEIVDAGTAKCLAVALKTGAADLGTAAYRLGFLNQHKLHMFSQNGTYSVLSDGYFIEKASRLTNASVILRQTLYIHQ